MIIICVHNTTAEYVILQGENIASKDMSMISSLLSVGQYLRYISESVSHIEAF